MVSNIATRALRTLLSLAALALPMTLLIFSACGGGSIGGSGGSSANGTSARMVSTFAGTATPGADGIGAAARFNWLNTKLGGVISDGTNLYVADSDSHTIRKIVIATGEVSTLAGRVGVAGAADGLSTSATFNLPTGITIDSTHTNLYVVDRNNNKIRQVTIATGAVSSFTGAPNTAVPAGAADGVAVSASFTQPYGITTDGTNLYIADSGNSKIRTIVIATGAVSSLTGPANTSVLWSAVDGPAAVATFFMPTGLTIDSTKTNLYVADTNNNKIRQVVIATGAVSSLTGASGVMGTTGYLDGAASSATFYWPADITTDGTDLYVTDTGNSNKIRKIAMGTATVSSLTGVTNTMGALGHADGAATAATFLNPSGITAVAGNLYVVDVINNTVRKVVISSGQVSTLAGNANPGADGSGATATFRLPIGIASDGVNLYVADSSNNTVRRIVIATGAVTTLAGQVGTAGAADGTGTAASFNGPYGIATDGVSLYLTERYNNKIRKITPASGSLGAMTSINAVVTSLTGAASSTVAAGASDGPAVTASFNWPRGIATDGVNLYVADGLNNKIRKVVIATGAVSSLTGASGVPAAPGAVDGGSAVASFNMPDGVTISGSNLYVADFGNNKIRQVVLTTGAVTSLTGMPNTPAAAGSADGAASVATFNTPEGIYTDGINLYVVDRYNNKIRQVVLSTGVVSSITGGPNTPSATGHADGAASAATFFQPAYITAVGGSLYVTEQFNCTIRKIQ